MLMFALCSLLPSTRAQDASILSAEFAVQGSPINPPPCTETADLDAEVRDFLPVTFSHQVDADSLSPEDFEVVLGTIGGGEQMTVTPGCATLAPAADPDELQTVLLVGDFTPADSDSLGPVAVNIVGDLDLLVNGTQENVNELTFSAPPGSFLFREMGPRILVAALLDVDDACEESPMADARARLIFGSGVRESVSGDAESFVVLGNGTTSPEAAQMRAAGMFDTSVGDVLSIADIDADNVVDICLKLSADGAMASSGTITMTCSQGPSGGPDFIVRDPEGQACEMDVKDLDMSEFMGSPAPAPVPQSALGEPPAVSEAMQPSAGAGMSPASAPDATAPEAEPSTAWSTVGAGALWAASGAISLLVMTVL